MIKRLPTPDQLLTSLKAWFNRLTPPLENGLVKTFDQTHLFPVYVEGSRTAQFFMNPVVVTPAIVSHAKDDRYGRKGHFTQFLKVPFDVPNYMGLCQEPGQRPWGPMDEIDASSIQVLELALSAKVNGIEHHFFIPCATRHDARFVRGPEGYAYTYLNMRIPAHPGFSVENNYDGKVGEELFADFLAAGYEPMFRIPVAGSYNRQTNNLKLADAGCSISSLRNIQTGQPLHFGEMSNELRQLTKTVSDITVVGVRMVQQLK